MYIHEAVRLAKRSGKYIRRETDFWRIIKLEPTDSQEGLIVHCGINRFPSPRWQPCAEDLKARDWIVVD